MEIKKINYVGNGIHIQWKVRRYTFYLIYNNVLTFLQIQIQSPQREKTFAVFHLEYIFSLKYLSLEFVTDFI